jgi:hypothetical protein
VFPEHRRLNRGFFYPVVLFRGHCCASPRHFRYGCSADAHGSLYLAPTRSAAQLSGDLTEPCVWRHTYKRRAARSGIERRVRFAMRGHTSTDEGDRYETPSVEDMAVEGRKFPRYEV